MCQRAAPAFLLSLDSAFTRHLGPLHFLPFEEAAEVGGAVQHHHGTLILQLLGHGRITGDNQFWLSSLRYFSSKSHTL